MGISHDYGGIFDRWNSTKKPLKRVYISGPMTGLPDLNFPAFNAEAKRLRKLGYDVVNPAELCSSSATWEECMKLDLTALLTCDILALLEGWQESRGAHLEMNVAHRVKIKIVLIADLHDPKTLDF